MRPCCVAGFDVDVVSRALLTYIFPGSAQTALRRQSHIDREELITYRFPILYYHLLGTVSIVDVVKTQPLGQEKLRRRRDIGEDTTRYSLARGTLNRGSRGCWHCLKALRRLSRLGMVF